jgi:hypothetical protein
VRSRSLVVRTELVPREREAGLIPPDADPRDAADLQDDRFVVDRLLDRDDVGLRLGPEIVVVTDPEMAVGGRGGAGHHVAAPALRPLRVRRVPQLLDGGREELERVDLGALRATLELLEQPGHGGGRGVAVGTGQPKLLVA